MILLAEIALAAWASQAHRTVDSHSEYLLLLALFAPRLLWKLFRHYRPSHREGGGWNWAFVLSVAFLALGLVLRYLPHLTVASETLSRLPWLTGPAVLLGFGFALLGYRMASRATELEGPATVVSRRLNQSPASRPDCYLTFRLSDGEELELSVTRHRFETLPDGTSGLLTWQNHQLREFLPDQEV